MSDELDPFLEAGLTPYDQIAFAQSFQIATQLLGRDNCWCLKKCNHSIFQGFTTSKNRLMYKGREAKPLTLAMIGSNYEPQKPIVVTRAICKSKYCLNPSHSYWGTRTDVAYEKAKRKKTRINYSLITKLKQEKSKGVSSLKLSKTYKIPYQTVRRICSNETYETEEQSFEIEDINKIWDKLFLTCSELAKKYPDEAKKFNLNYHVKNELECPWHQKDHKAHKGNFGLMGECLDCMEEVKAGRCVIDVRNFDFKWYWQVRGFWQQVDIKGQDECWQWTGATRKNNTESTAYFPSPFHSAKTQSASRIAFWLSRGYTGKYRIFTKPSCKPFCCNPLHLTIKELKNYPSPQEIVCVKLNHDNIFKHHKERKSSVKKE